MHAELPACLPAFLFWTLTFGQQMLHAIFGLTREVEVNCLEKRTLVRYSYRVAAKTPDGKEAVVVNKWSATC